MPPDPIYWDIIAWLSLLILLYVVMYQQSKN